MAKTEKAKFRNFYVINVKLRNNNNTNDATPDQYANLFKRLFDKKVHKESSNGKHCIIKSLVIEKENDKLIYYSGTLAKFTYVTNKNWLNLNSLDLDEAFQLPEGLFPDAVFTDYVFIPEAHRFIFRTASDISISPYPVKKFLEFALDEVCKQNEYVQVDVEKDKASINEIINAIEIKKLTIDINYSNFDNTDDFQKFFEDDIKNGNVSRIILNVSQKPNNSIDINKSQIIKSSLLTSISNGETEARIVNKYGQAETIKTSDYPLRESVESTITRFNQAAYEKIMSIFRKNNSKNKNKK